MRILFISNRIARMRTRISDTFTLPEKYKGTIVEKWAKYWRGLIGDYSEVLANAAKEARAKPRKAVILGGISYALYACAERNPGDEELTRALRNWNNRFVLVPPTQMNPQSASHLQELERAVNQNTLRTMSLGLCTIVWVDLFDKDDCTYQAICEYTGVSYWNFHERVVDVGFWNRFWRLEWKMQNYDVNYL